MEADPTESGQYLLNYLPGSAGAYGQRGVLYIPEIKHAGADWYQPNAMTVGRFDLTVRVPVNLHALAEGTPVSVRLRSGNISSPPLSGVVSNSLDLTLLPFRPSLTYHSFDINTGQIRWSLQDNSKIPHDFLFEISEADAQGNATTWTPLTHGPLLQDPSYRPPEFQVCFTPMPPEYESKSVLLRVRTVDGPRLSPPTTSNLQTMGLAVPSGFTATPGPNGISLDWTSHTRSTSATLLVCRYPGAPAPAQTYDFWTVATLSPATTHWQDLPPLEGSYRYQLVLLDSPRVAYGPTVAVTTQSGMLRAGTPFTTRQASLLARLPSGHLIVSGSMSGASLVEVTTAGVEVSSFTGPSDGTWDRAGALVDEAGVFHLLMRYFDTGLSAQGLLHVWLDPSGWHSEKIPAQGILYGSLTGNDGPRLHLGAPGELWAVEARSSGDNTPLAVGFMTRKDGIWSGARFSGLSSDLPISYLAGMPTAVDGTGSLFVAYQSSLDQILLQRRLDGTVIQTKLPYLTDPTAPYSPTRSLDVVSLIASPDGSILILRLWNTRAVVQRFSGGTFSDPEEVPIPTPLLQGSLSSQTKPSLSASGARLAWTLTSSKFSFLALRGPAGWTLNALPAPGVYLNFCSGFQEERFYTAWMRPAPALLGNQIQVDLEP